MTTLTLALAGVAGAPAADAASVFGSNLLSTPTGANGCGPPSCTQWNAGLQSGNIAGTLDSPIDGVVVSFTLSKAVAPGPWTPLHLRVVRASSGNWRGLAASSPDVVPTQTGGLETFGVRVPIAADDFVAIEQSGYLSSSAVFATGGPVFGASAAYVSPQLPADGSAAAAATYNYELLLQARVEPDADHDGYGDETQDGCPANPGASGPCPVAATKPNKSKRSKKCRKKKRADRAAVAAKRKKCRREKRK